MKKNIITYGCRLNAYESETISRIVDDLNLENKIIINSCAVTNEVERQVKQKIRKIHRETPEIEIIVTGCAAQLSPSSYACLPGVTKVIGNDAKLQKNSYTDSEKVNVRNSDQNSSLTLPTIDSMPYKSRALVQIQTGCNHDCTFCATTIARGKNRSRAISSVIEQIEKFTDNGYNEVVLTGVDISDYGKDCNSSLLELIKEILAKNHCMPRIRLSSIDVAEIDEELKHILCSEKRLMPHIHLSIQSGNDLILKRMKRRHNSQQIIDFCSDARKARPSIIFGADLIAGFPTETESMFEDTIETVLKAGLTYLHVFPYSPKEGTAAARMPQVATAIKKMRAAKLRELAKKLMNEFLQMQIGKTLSAIIEKNNYGRSENFALVQFDNKKNLPIKTITNIKIHGVQESVLHGELV